MCDSAISFATAELFLYLINNEDLKSQETYSENIST
jgi:hypothetical protein